MRFKKGNFADWHHAMGSPLPSFFFGFPLDSPYDFGVCELVEVLMHAPLVGFGAPPWWCEKTGSTNFV